MVVVLDVVALFCFFWEVRGVGGGGYVVLCPITELCCFRVQ